ncbi:YaiI/YqxD family protein, partial [Bacillus cereus]
MKIYVDADACPVKDVIIFEATNAEIPVTLVTSFSHYSNAQQPKGVETIY